MPFSSVPGSLKTCVAALSLSKPQNYTQPLKKKIPSGAQEQKYKYPIMIPLASYSVTSKSCTPLSLLQESHDPFQFSSGFTGRGLPSDRDFSVQVHFLLSSAEAQAGAAALCRWFCSLRTSSAVPGAAHPARSLTPPPPPPSALSCTHPPKPANNPPCTLNPLGQQPGHPILGEEKGKNTGPGRGRTIPITFVCHYLMSTQFRTFFPWGEASAEYELGTLLLWKLSNITSPASEEFIQPPGC